MNSKITIISSIVLTAVIVGGGTYCLVSRRARADKATLQHSIDSLNQRIADLEKPSPSPTIAVSPSSVPTPTDETANWKTYSNNSLGFSLKYPSNLIAELTADTNTLSIYDPTEGRPNTVALVSVSPTSLTLDQFLADLKNDSVVSAEQRTTLANIAAYEGIDRGLISMYGLYSVANGKSYILRFPTNNKDTLSDIKSGLSATQKLTISRFRFVK